jgi:hypothetical protein
MFVSSSLFNTKTVFSRNVNTVNGPMATKEAKVTASIDIYVKLSKFVSTIRYLLIQYASANFYAVAHALTLDAYRKLSIDLNALAADANKYNDYENIRRGIVESLQGLYQSVLQHNILMDTEAKLSVANKNLETLYDPVKLRAYIELMNQRRTLFDESKVKTTVAATLKPEYAEYIRLYGYPEGSVFDMDKLAQIINRLPK